MTISAQDNAPTAQVGALSHSQDTRPFRPLRSSTMPRLDSLTGLRALAAAAVVLVHAHLLWPDVAALAVFWNGRTAVSFFFVLSGFVLTWSARPGDTNARFWTRRAARILPLHVATWCGTALLMLALGEAVDPAAFLAGLALLQVWIPDASYAYRVNQPAWSIGVEAFFYLLFPVVLAAARRLTTRRMMLGGALTLWAGSVVWAVAANHVVNSGRLEWALWVAPPVRLAEFATGVLLALAVADGWRPRARSAVLAAPFVFVAAAGLLLDVWEAWLLNGVAHLALIPAHALVIACVAARDVDGTTWLSSSPMVRLGDWSFAAYLVHWPVLYGVAHSPLEGTLWGLCAALAAVIPLAGLLHVAVERPVERAVRGRVRTKAPALP